MMFELWQLAMLDDAGYSGIRDEHIDRVAESLIHLSVQNSLLKPTLDFTEQSFYH